MKSSATALRGPWGKWWLVGMYWVVQTIFVLSLPVIIAGDLTSPDALVQALGECWRDPWLIGFAGAVTVAQLIFVLPVRRPALDRARGWSVTMSLAVAGLGAAMLFLGLVMGVLELIEFVGGGGSELDMWVWRGAFWGALGLGWVVATPLLIAFASRHGVRRESLLGRIAARLFLGTIIETAAIIPLDVMVRRRSSCYCGEGTFYALLICGGVGMFALGPAIWLPLLARRRKRWYEGRCDACGYDMRGTPRAERCPECGAGWRGVGS